MIVNGEIYNHEQIRAEFKNYPFYTTSDSEYVLFVSAFFLASFEYERHTPSLHKSPNRSMSFFWFVCVCFF